jgi:hypothetical protein
MPNTTSSTPTAKSGTAPQQPARSANKSRAVAQIQSGDAAMQQIMTRLGSLDSRLTELVENKQNLITVQISETLNSQSQAIIDVADVLKSLQCSLVSAVTDALEDQRRDQVGRKDSSEMPADDGMESGSHETENGELPGSSWNDIRNAFLTSHGENVPVEATASATENVARSAVVERPLAEELEVELPLFTTIGDPHALSEDELRTAVIDQERTISVLVSRLQKKSRAAQPISREQLEELRETLPEQIQQQVSETLSALNNQHRYAELELSLERARVSRQASQLEVTRERLDARARSMGLEISETGTIQGTSAKRGSKGRNWLGAMGFGN